ncbi:MAG TPA: copper resistance protein CopC [Solirubrobacteraceae bacterium]
MSRRSSRRARGRRAPLIALVAIVAFGLLPAAAAAHAYLLSTSPTASGILNAPPRAVSLTFDEPVEPRFAIISVTDAQGRQQALTAPRRSAANPDTLIVPVRPRLPEGWYLIYWRAISVDGHPVQGAFTYAVGPNPGPAPQFPVPHLSASAVTAPLLITRWLMFLSVMVSIGLFALRLGAARPAIRRVPGTDLHALDVAAVVSSLLALLAIPVYLDVAIANDSLRSAFDLGALVPLYRVTAFGRGYLDLWLCFALFCTAAWIALWLDRPDRPRRSVAELGAGTGAALAAAGVLFIPGAVGHAGQTSPRGLAVALDAVHLLSGSLWLGGLAGLLVLWFGLRGPGRVAALSVIVPRFSALALGSVLLLLGTGTGATILHMPTLDALWKTSYGVAILVKIGLLAAASGLAAGNLLRTRPRLAAARERPDRAAPAARLLGRLIGGEAIIVTGAVFTAAVLSSLAPPPPAFALADAALAHVGPGRVLRTVDRAGYRLQVLVSPNRAAAPDRFALRLTRHGRPVTGAVITLAFNHLQMQMPQQEYSLHEVAPGIYARSAPALIMVGPWGLTFTITPPGHAPFNALIVDQANG